jgi:hypothetical protein
MMERHAIVLRAKFGGAALWDVSVQKRPKSALAKPEMAQAIKRAVKHAVDTYPTMVCPACDRAFVDRTHCHFDGTELKCSQ